MKAMGGDGGNRGALGVRPRTYLPSETRRTTQVDRSRDATIREEERGREENGSTHTHASYSQDSDTPPSNQNNSNARLCGRAV